jgi:hypothetical protein
MSRSRSILVILLVSLQLAVTTLHAHEMRPAYLQIRQTGKDSYVLLWKIPRVGNEVISIKPAFPDWFKVEQRVPATESGTGALFTFQATSARDIHGMPFTIDGLRETIVDVLVQVDFLDGEQNSFLVQPINNHAVIPQQSGTLETVKGYFVLGVEHIWTGFDHLMFVLALLIITMGYTRRLLITVTAFTLAHSITLSLAALGYVGLPGPPVEATIALSIVFLAVEIIRGQQGHPTLTSQKPWLVAFIFGLLHGLGFARALVTVGLPQKHIPLALAFFNIGVEAGQIAFIMVVLLLLKLLASRLHWPLWVRKLPAYGIGSLAAFWLIDRVVAFWS